jgi:hypothetical protein
MKEASFERSIACCEKNSRASGSCKEEHFLLRESPSVHFVQTNHATRYKPLLEPISFRYRSRNCVRQIDSGTLENASTRYLKSSTLIDSETGPP